MITAYRSRSTWVPTLFSLTVMKTQKEEFI